MTTEEPMLPEDRSQQILASKDADEALASCQEHGYSEGWAIIDGAVVIYNLDAPPHWLPADDQRDENGNTREFVLSVDGAKVARAFAPYAE